MPFFEAGNWTVTTTDDAYGNADGHNDPATTDPLEPWWCVYDADCDDEPIAQGMTFAWAQRVAQAMHFAARVLALTDELDAALAPDHMAMVPDPEPVEPVEFTGFTTIKGVPAGDRRDPYEAVEPKGYWVACCEKCDGGRIMPLPFSTEADRSRHIHEHHMANLSHDRWYLVNPDGTRKHETFGLGISIVRSVVLVQPKINGKPFRCAGPPHTTCGSNVFKHREGSTSYKCNACGEEYEGTKSFTHTVIDHPEPDTIVDELSGITDIGTAFLGTGVTGFPG